MNNRFTINGTNPLSQGPPDEPRSEDKIVRDMLDNMKGLETQLDRSKAAHDTFMKEHAIRHAKHLEEMARLDRQWRWLKVFMIISVTAVVISCAITIWKTL